ncbi:MAG TPA: hypothetical protein VIF88_08180 [Methylocystis sp.]|jgi:hypothetical protein
MNDSSILSAVRAAASPLLVEPGVMTGVVAQKDHDAALVSARADGLAAGKAEGESAGAIAERTRIAAIFLDSEEAKGRDKQARYFAFKTSMTPDEARAALSEAPVAEAPKAPTLLDEMKMIKQPALGADGGPNPSQMSDYEKGAAEAKRLFGIK